MKLALDYGSAPGSRKAPRERAAAPSRSPWSVGARSETGYVRSENEDRMARVRSGDADLYVVVDGMGGHEGGALAAELTADTLCDAFAAAPRQQARETSLRLAFAQANAAVHARARQSARSGNGGIRGMGATAVALLTVGRRFMVAHVGDSRAYLLRRGQLQRLTRDHSRVQRLVDAGMLSPQEAAGHPDASVVERAMGHQPTVEVECSAWQQLRRGDRLLLCSDGLCGYARDEEILHVLQAGGSAQEQVDGLVKLALSKGGEDNVTVQLACYGPMAGGEGRAARGLPVAALALSLASLGLAGAAGWAALDQRSRLQELRAVQAVADARLDLHAERVAALEEAARQPRAGHAVTGPAAPPAPAPAPAPAASTAQAPRPAPAPHAARPRAAPRKPAASQARPSPRPRPADAASAAASIPAAAASKPAPAAETSAPASAP